MKIVFMGTPDIAVHPLKALIAAGHEISAVVTREDKPKGRGYELAQTPVKEEAVKHGIPVLHPKRLKDEEFINELKSYNADVFVVIAYGRIIPKAVLDIPKLGCINIHASLLPSYRGAAPIQWAVIDGLSETGITTMLMDEGLDTGDILKQYRIEIAEDETGGSLFDKLAILAETAIVDTLSDLEKGTLSRTKQGETDTRYASMLKKEDGLIDWNKPSIEIERLVRGLNPWPSAFTYFNDKMIKIWKGKVSDSQSDRHPGTVVSVSKDSITVACGDGLFEITELQPEGKKRMSAADFLRGNKIERGAVLGKE